MNANETDKKIVQAIIQEPVGFKVKIDNPSFWHKIGFLPKVRQFKIYPLHPGTVIRISEVINSLRQPEQKKEVGEVLRDAVADMKINMPRLILIVALAISNREERPSQRLLRFLTWNAADKLPELTNIVLSKMDVMHFTTSIISLKGMSLITEEIIATDKKAPGESSEDSSNITDAALNTPSGE